MKKLNKTFKTFSREEISKVKGGKKATKVTGHERAMENGASPCPPPEPDSELI